jgi:23S rRNA pseudouridine2605 synthase
MSERGQDERIVPMRLQRFLARAGVASRRGSENLMTAGRVTVNGVVVTELGSKVDPRVDEVAVDGQVVRLGDGHVYVMLNKPRGYLTTMSDDRGRACVASLVPVDRYPGLFPVGRLDADTTGLLLFTTNGDVAARMLHPSSHVWKHYVALVQGIPTEEELERLRQGVELDDGMTAPCKVRLIRQNDAKGTAVVGLSIHEGKKHQVKRMLAVVGHEVLRLHRDRFGPLVLKDVEEGAWRLLTDEERAALEG